MAKRKTTKKSPPVLTVRQVIEVLQNLPPEFQDKPLIVQTENEEKTEGYVFTINDGYVDDGMPLLTTDPYYM